MSRGAGPLSYHLQVLAPSAAAAVRATGGWLVDQVMSGWQVSAALSDHAEQRPLRILGVAVTELASAATRSTATAEGTLVLAVAAELYDRDERVHALAHAALDRGTDVLLWGDAAIAEGAAGNPVCQQLSGAARVFKARALAAAGITAAVEPTETLWTFRAPPSASTTVDQTRPGVRAQSAS